MIADAPTLLDRRATAQADLAELERAQGAAVLDGQAFDAARLAECRAELDGLDAAEAEAVRRDRGGAAAAEAQKRAEARKALAVTLDSYMEAVGRSEASAKAMVADLALVESLADTMRLQLSLTGRRGIPGSLAEIRSKHSAMLATQLRTLGGPHRYGVLSWHSFPPIADLVAYAQKYVAAAVQPYIEGE